MKTTYKWKTFNAYIRKGSLTILALFLLFLLAAKFLSPDIKPIDDSFMDEVYKKVPDELNGYLYFQQAAEGPLAKPLYEAEFYHEPGTMPPVDISDPEFLKMAKSKYKEVFALMDRAAEMPYSQAPAQPPPKFSDPLPTSWPHRKLVELRLAIAKQDYSEEETGEFISQIENAVELARVMETAQGGETLLREMIAITIRSLAIKALDERISLSGLPDGKAKSLQAFLESHKLNRDALKESFKTEYRLWPYIMERAGHYDISYISHIRDWGYGRTATSFIFFKPNKVLRRIYAHYASLIQNIDKFCKDMTFTESAAAPTSFGSAMRDLANGDFEGRRFWDEAMPNFRAALDRKCYGDFFVDAMRLKIALLAFERDAGQMPDSLQQLTPTYIDEVPRDAFDGNPMRYDKERNIIYSVGWNLVDDGGSSKHLGFIANGKEASQEKDLVVPIR